MNENNVNSNGHFTTSKGYEIEFFGIATLMDRYNASRKIPQPPMYDTPTATGIVEHHPHTPQTLTTDAERQAYAEYEAAVAKEEIEHRLKSLKLVLLKGIRVVNAPDNEDWVNEQKAFGIAVPDDPLERKFHWIYTEVIGNLDDLAKISDGVQKASGVSEEEINQTLENSFRHPLSQDAANETSPTVNAGSMDVLESVRASGNGNQEPLDREPVRRSKRKR